jgi:DNA-binding GntR family transcriptional regulator
LATLIRSRIEDGTLKPQQCVSITTLAQEHRMNRQTAGKSLRLLVEQGWLIRWPGIGYVVARR